MFQTLSVTVLHTEVCGPQTLGVSQSSVLHGVIPLEATPRQTLGGDNFIGAPVSHDESQLIFISVLIASAPSDFILVWSHLISISSKSPFF